MFRLRGFGVKVRMGGRIDALGGDSLRLGKVAGKEDGCGKLNGKCRLGKGRGLAMDGADEV